MKENLREITVVIVGQIYDNNCNKPFPDKGKGEIRITCGQNSKIFYWCSEKGLYQENFSIKFFENGKMICNFDNTEEIEEQNSKKIILSLFQKDIEDMHNFGLPILMNKQVEIKRNLPDPLTIEPKEFRRYLYDISQEFYNAVFVSEKVAILQEA